MPKLTASALTRSAVALRKVPEITFSFWFVKLLTTGLGEVFSDFLVRQFNPIIAVIGGAVGFVVALALQLLVPKYIAGVYWLVVVMVAIFGTMAADVLHVALGVPYLISTTFFVIALAAVFGVWYASEQTLSIHSISSTRREVFYWAAVITTFALGTAAGDMTANTMQLGYFASGALFSVLIGLSAIAYWRFDLQEVPAFWIAYILTRPLGASFADWVGRDRLAGGLGVGTGWVSLGLSVVIVLAVGYLSIPRNDSAVARQSPR
jgi:uncharacterized membrane-anchored protein